MTVCIFVWLCANPAAVVPTGPRLPTQVHTSNRAGRRRR